MSVGRAQRLRPLLVVDEDIEEVQNQGKGGYVAYRNIKNHSSGGNRVVIGGIVVSRAGAVGRER